MITTISKYLRLLIYNLFLLGVLIACNKKNENLRIVKSVNHNLFEFSSDSLKKYLGNNFILVFEGREFKNEHAIELMESYLPNQEIVGVEVDSVSFFTVSDNEFRVTYFTSDWASKCLGLDHVINVDTYYLIDKAIVKIEKSRLNKEVMDSVSIANQKLFYQWIDDNNHVNFYMKNGSIDHSKYFDYLKLYCNLQ